MEKEIIRYNHVHGISIIDQNMPSSFPVHWHNSAEFTFVLKKGCRFRIGEQIYEPDAGDVLFAWSRELHEILQAAVNSCLLLQVSSNVIENSTDLAAAMRFFNKCHYILAEKEPELSARLFQYLYELKEIYQKEQYFMETRCKLMAYQILLEIGEYVMREHRELIGDEHFSTKAWAYIRSACSFIAEHSDEDISQVDVADAVGLSPYYFSKLFKDYTRTTFPAYLSGIRVQNVINLLTNEQLSVTECAFLAGFQSTTTFNKVFRETIGCSPKEYRKLHSTTQQHKK